MANGLEEARRRKIFRSSDRGVQFSPIGKQNTGKPDTLQTDSQLEQPTIRAGGVKIPLAGKSTTGRGSSERDLRPRFRASAPGRPDPSLSNKQIREAREQREAKGVPPLGPPKRKNGDVPAIDAIKPVKKVTPKGGLRKKQKRKSLDPFTVKGIGNIGSTFGELAGEFFSPEARKRRAVARKKRGAVQARAAGVKSRRAESEAGSKRITALSGALKNLGIADDEGTRGLIGEQLRNLISPTDPQETLDLKSTLRR